MIKFIHKKHIHESKDSGKIIIYYNFTDIFLGTALLVLVVFFINDYLSHALKPKNNNVIYTDKLYGNQRGINSLVSP